MNRPRTAALLAAVLALAPRPARAGDPHLVYHTIDTPHFEITYYDPEGPVAERLARVAERAHDLLVPVMGWEPRERTQIVLTDNTDDANGSATAIPYDEIRLYLTAPDDLSQLNDYDDWLFGLVAHEYTHILHLDNITGLPRLINTVLGKTYAPNGVEPRWFIEGFATLEESAETTAGRERNAIFDMYLRMAILDGKNLHGLDQTSNDPLSFPQATTAYLYGSHFMRWIADRFGDDKLARISAIYGNRVIPFSMNRTAKAVLGGTYEELWTEWMAELRHKYRLQKEEAERRGLTPFRVLVADGQYAGAPRYTRDGGHILFLKQDGRHRDGYYEIGAPERGAQGAERLALPIEAAGAGSFTPDGRELVFQRSDYFNANYFYDDLFVLDLASGDVRKLTSGLRAAEPDVSPDGKRVAFTVNGLGNKSLVAMPLGGGAPTALVPARDFTEIYTPAWSPDGTRIAYSAWTRGGFRDVYVVTVATGAVERITADRALDVDPRFSPDGRYLYFCSDRTGIYDLYAYDLVAPDHPLWQVTNVLDGVFQPDISPDGRHVVYSGFASTGYEIHEADLDPGRFLPALPYVNTRDPVEIVPDDVHYPVRDYDPFETLWPHAWCLPTFGTNGTFGPFLSGCVNGQDAVGYHGWGVSYTYNPGNGTLTGALDYSYSRLWPSLGLHLGRDLYPRSGLFIDGHNNDYIEQAVAAGASMTLPLIASTERFLNLTLSYGATWTSDFSHPPVPLDPNAEIPVYPQTGRLAGATLQLGYSNVYRTIYGVGPVAGRSFGLGLQLEHPALGSDWSYLVGTYRYTESLAMPWAPDHTLQLHLAGGVATGNYPRGGVFGIGGFGPPVTRMAYAPQTLIYDALESVGGGLPSLPGYPPGVRYGAEFQLGSIQYAFPILMIERGYATLPVYVRRLEGVFYSDAGNAFTRRFDASRLLWSLGGELRLDMQFGWYVPGTVEIGYARGLTGPGVGQWYVMMGAPL